MNRAGLALVVLVASACAPAARADSGGGSVSNVPPTIDAFGSQSAVANHETRLVGVAADRNGESDLTTLRLRLVSPAPTQWANHTLTGADLAATTEPAAATAGWRVWNPVPNNGLLSWSFAWTPAVTGSHAWNLTVEDEVGNATQQLTLTVASPGGGGGGGSAGNGGSAAGESATGGSPAGGGSGPGTPAGGDDGQDPAPVTGDDLEGSARDLSWSLLVGPDGHGNVLLQWNAVPGAMGYQVWRHTSPWVLVADLPAGDTNFTDKVPSKTAYYKVTFYTERTLAGGWAPDGVQASLILGWEESAHATLEHSPVQVRPLPMWVPAALAGVAAAVGGGALWSARKKR